MSQEHARLCDDDMVTFSLSLFQTTPTATTVEQVLLKILATALPQAQLAVNPEGLVDLQLRLGQQRPARLGLPPPEKDFRPTMTLAVGAPLVPEVTSPEALATPVVLGIPPTVADQVQPQAAPPLPNTP